MPTSPMPPPLSETPATALPEHLRELDDMATTRKWLVENTLSALGKRFPYEDATHRLELSNLRAGGETADYGPGAQKRALLQSRKLTIPIKGTWRLVDRANGTTIEERDDTVMHLPYLTERGTFLNNGTEYSGLAQSRLKPGVYTRQRRTGDVEAHFNLKGRARGFRLDMEPETGVFKMHMQQASLPLYHVLKASGVTDERLKEAWGPEVWMANAKTRDTGVVGKLFKKFFPRGVSDVPDEAPNAAVRRVLMTAGVDPTVMRATVGLDTDTVNDDVFIKTSRRLLDIHKGLANPDDRDHPAFSRILGVEDQIPDRIERDAGKLARTMFWKAKNAKGLKRIPSGALNSYVSDYILSSGLAMPLEETNHLSLLEQMHRVTKFGDGGIAGEDSLTDEARDVNPGQLGFVDPIAAPESGAAGADFRLAYKTYKGKDGQMHAEFKDSRTGKMVYLRPEDTLGKVIAFPNQMDTGEERVSAIVAGQLADVDRAEVDYEVPTAAHMYSPNTNLNPMRTAYQAGRGFYSSKFWPQYMPLVNGETPLVEPLVPDDPKGRTMGEFYGNKLGAIRASEAGTVTSVSEEADGVRLVKVKGVNGTKTYELVQNLPFNRLTGQTFIPTVKPGDVVAKDQLIAHSNFTDSKTGALNIGRNLRVAVIPYKGESYEDGMTISETAAKLMTNDRLFAFDETPKNGTSIGTSKYVSLFPGRFTKQQLASMDAAGVAKVGAVLKDGDPIVLAVGPRVLSAEAVQMGKLHKSLRNTFTDKVQLWENDYDGVVVDSVVTPGGKVRVSVKAQVPVKQADKLADGFGLKGVVNRIIPDDEMPRDPATNEPYHVLMNPLGMLSRVADGSLLEIGMAKLAKKLGHSVKLPVSAPKEGWDVWLDNQLKTHGIESDEMLYDPLLKRNIGPVLSGYKYYHAFHHIADKKMSDRGSGGSYTAEEQPARGGGDTQQAKRSSRMDMDAMLAHGATGLLREIQTVRGAKNEDFWRALRSGRPLPDVKTPMIYDKFLDTLRAGGIQVRDQGDTLKLFPMTDADVSSMSKGELTSSELVDADFRPVAGGLFDVGTTGGVSGKRWTHITLPEPVPNPVFEDPIRRLLGVTKGVFRNILAGREALNGKRGGAAILEAMQNIDVDKEIERNKEIARKRSGNTRDGAIKALGYLGALKRNGVKPADWVITKVPVLPPIFRPISKIGDVTLQADLNELYRDLFETSKSMKALKKEAGDDAVTNEREQLYDAVSAVFGLGDPITPEGVAKRLKGAVRQITGETAKCYDAETEILTENGWLPFPKLRDGVKVATVRPVDGVFEWQTPSEVHRIPYNGTMVRSLSPRRVDMLVTPEHVHYTSQKTSGTAWRPYQKMYAAHLVDNSNRMHMRVAAEQYTGTSIAEAVSGFGAKDATAVAWLIGFWLAEGWTDRYGTSWTCQAERAKVVPEIDAMYARSGLPFSRKRYRYAYKGKKHWVIWWGFNKDISAWLKSQCWDGAKNKRIGRRILAGTKNELTALYHGYMDGDGENIPKSVATGTRTWRHKRIDFSGRGRGSTVSKGLSDDFAELAVKIGCGYTRGILYLNHKNSKWNDQYRFKLHGHARCMIGPHVKHTWQQYRGEVYCVTVPAGAVVVRRGKHSFTFVSGNSGLFQSRVLSKPVDSVGRAVVTADPNMHMDQVGIPEDSAWVLYRSHILRRLSKRGIPMEKSLQMVDAKDPIAYKEMREEMKVRPVILDRAPTWHKFNLLAFYPIPVKGSSVRASPLISKGFTLDHDGDQMNFHVPATDDGVSDALTKMLPSKNLTSLTDLHSPRHTPQQEFILGLYAATREPSKKPPRVFATAADAKRAFDRGELKVNDPITIGG